MGREKFPLLFLCSCLIIFLSVIDGQKVPKESTREPHHLAYFYDPKTNRTIRPPIVSFHPEEEEQLKQNRPTGGRRCDCKRSGMANVCSCCAGLKLPRIRFQREMCTRFQYNHAQGNTMQMDVTMNGNSIGSQTFNFRAPESPPMCFPLPIPFIPLYFDACVRIFDVNFVGRNAHFCMDWSARVQKAPLILLHFDCAQFGADGISFLKPGQSPVSPGAAGGFPSVINPGGVIGGGGGGGGVPAIGGGGGGGAVPAGGSSSSVPAVGVGGGPINVVPVVPSSFQPGAVGPIPTYLTTTSAPISMTPSTTGTGPDENGNLPQVAAGTDDLDNVEGLKYKQNNTRFNPQNYYNSNRIN